MPVAADFAGALAALLAAVGEPAPAEPQVRMRSGTLELAVTIAADAVEVTLSGWRQRFALPDDEDGADAAALALDLIGAALFGAVRVAADSYDKDGPPRRFTLQVLGPAGWQTATTQGSRPWNPLARRARALHLGATPRPPRYAAVAVAALPWAPWAGLAGFFGAPAATAPAELPVDGELDLHNFHPREVKPLVLAYLDACIARQIFAVRIVHGKGVGNLRRTVHALLERHPRVKGFRPGGHGGGSWGATLVDLSREPGPTDAD